MDKLLNKLVVTKLKDVIKAIRSAKTMADERAVIAKESAFIRTAIKDEVVETRYYNVQKLLYIHMLGYPAHFGQIECLKLVASPKYSDKRLGYLGIMMLLDESQETLTLVTNCLQNDMNSSNVFISALALCTLGNISSPEMSRDLCSHVEKLVGSPNAYLRKKAALCAIRIIKKVPDLIENFVEKAKKMLVERNEASLLTAIALEIEMCKLNPAIIPEFKEQVPILVKHLKNLLTSGFSTEYEVGGVADPFLQIKILRLLRILGAGDARSSEIMNDVLAQVATTTDSSKNVGNAVLYEVVLTIMGIEAEVAVKVLAINILGKFLTNADNNIRYVALTTLTKTYHKSLLLTSQNDSTTSLQRHRATILACLRDPDATLRAKALDLAFLLLTRQNAPVLMKELLSYLDGKTVHSSGDVMTADARAAVARKIVEYAARFRVNQAWEIFVNIRVLLLAGDAASVDAVVHNFLKILSVAEEELQVVAARRLFWTVKRGGDLVSVKEGYVAAMAWCCGEFGDMIVDHGFAANGGGADIEDIVEVVGGGDDFDDESVFAVVPTEKEIVDQLESVLKGHFSSPVLKSYVITALIKLSVRFSDAVVLQKISTLITKYRTNIDVEIQARAVEFSAITDMDIDVKSGILERMPALDSALKEEEMKGTGEPIVRDSQRPSTASVPSKPAATSAVQDLLDLNFDIVPTPVTTTATSSQHLAELFGGLTLIPATTVLPASDSIHATQSADILSDLFTPNSARIPASIVTSDPLADLIKSSNITIDALPSTSTTLNKRLCFEKSGLKIYLIPQHATDKSFANVNAIFENDGFAAVTNLSFQVAVPKSLRLQINPPSSAFIPPKGTATQSMKIENPSKAVIKLRLKIGFLAGNEAVEDLVEVGGL